jgi:hypothetical protein
MDQLLNEIEELMNDIKVPVNSSNEDYEVLNTFVHVVSGP